MLIRPWITSVLLLAIALIAACGPRTEVSLEAPDVLPSPVNASLDATEEAPFTVDVIGDISIGMPPGEVEYSVAPARQAGDTSVPEHYELVFRQDAEDTRYSIILMFPIDLKPGTYDITGGALDPVNPGIAAELAHGSVDGPPDQRVVYNTSVEGSFTLDRSGDTVSGSFEFAAEAPASGEAGAIPPTANVAGTFTDIALTGPEPTAEPTAEATES